MGLKVAIFSSAFCFVSAPIHGRPSMISFIAESSLRTSSCTRALAAGGKKRFTYSCPSASPRSWSVFSAQRFQRGFICGTPASSFWLKAKSSSAKGFDSHGAAELRSCHLR